MEVMAGVLQGEARWVHQTVSVQEERLSFRAGSAAPASLEAGGLEGGATGRTLPSEWWLFRPRDSEAEHPIPGGVSLTQMVLETFFGMKVRVFLPEEFDPSRSRGDADGEIPADATLPAGGGADWSLRWERTEVREQMDSLDLRFSGSVETSEGDTLSFDLALNLRRYRREEIHQSVSMGAPWQDPLVLTLPGQGVPSFKEGERMRLDLNRDGREESLPLLVGQSGFLVLDHNGNGRVDDGAEMLGALTGDGFAELRSLDEDGNLWIDARDPVFMDLRFWQPQEEGLRRLEDLGVGAISLSDVGAGSWEWGDDVRLRSSSAALFEDGQASWVHQVDLRAGD